MRLFLCFAIALLFTSGCYKKESTLTDSLIYCAENYPQSFNPQINHDPATLDATTHQLYNRLLKIDPLTKTFIPDLATHWRQGADQLSYTFFLRKNVSFHNTSYFTGSRFFNADDVIFSFQRMLNVDHPFHSINRVTDSYFFNHPFTTLVADIVKVDEHTIKFILNKPDVTLLANLAAHYSVILSHEYAENLLAQGKPEEIDFYPVGTGPYKFKNSQPAGVTRYLTHPQYWHGAPALKMLVFDVTTNNTKRYTKLLSGECDVITYPAPSQLDKIRHNNNVVLSSKPTSALAFWSFNLGRRTFADKRTRRALSYAIDQQTIINAVFFQTANTSNSLLAKQSWAYSQKTTGSQYRPQLALKQLKEINFDFEKSISILTPIDNSLFNPNFHKTAELIQSNLSAIGINSKIISLPKAKLENRLASGNYDTYLSGINLHINDPDSLFRPLLSCDASILEGNSSQWCSQQVQDLLDAAIVESDYMQRFKNYDQLQEILQQERPYYPIAHILRIDAYNKNISGLQVDPLTGINFQNVRKVEAL